MRDGPSVTAQRVAAFRLLLDRPAGAGGSPEDDAALARDVAAGCAPVAGERIRRYLEARTFFFDRVVLRAIERGVTQVVIVGAGYDGRALRYGRTGISWWEVDDPATQEDKQARLDRLGIEAPQVTFVPLDLEKAALADPLVESGFCPEAPTLVCCEGVLAYLSRPALERLLGDCRSLASPGTRLAASVSLARGAPEAAARRTLADALAEVGEPLQDSLEPDELDALLTGTRWRLADVAHRARHAGLVLLAPVWGAPPPGMRPSAGGLARFADRMLARPDEAAVVRHLADTYNVSVRTSQTLDLGVHRVDLDGRRQWIARVHPKDRDAAVRAEAALLRNLAATGFPCERPAAEPAVSSIDGWPVLVTERVPGKSPAAKPDAFGVLGDLLGRLHAWPTTHFPELLDGGAWHHLVPTGTPSDEIAALRSLLADAAHRVRSADAERFETVVAGIDGADDGSGLPCSLVHPDPVPRNLVRSADGAFTLVDWSGAGRGPRLASLGCLLWAGCANLRNVQAAAIAYRRSVALTVEELDRLEGAMMLRPVVLAGWTLATGRDRLANVAEWLAASRRHVQRAAPSARAVLAGDLTGN